MLDTALSLVMKRDFHILCSRRNDTRPVLAVRHGTVAANIQPK